MRLLGFVLESAALAGIVAAAATVVVLAAFWVARPVLARLTPSRRSDVAYAAAMLPGVTTIAVVAAAALPSLWQALVQGRDHCLDHAHHAHLCVIHFDGLRPGLAVVGAGALMAFVARLISLVRGRVLATRAITALEAMGHRAAPATSSSRTYPLVRVPGPPRFCHAVGLADRRILISESLATALTPELLSAAVLHEQEHLRRFDGLARLVLEVVNLFALPLAADSIASEAADAAEHACDAAAGAMLGNPLVVAESLVEVSRISARWHCASTAPAFLGRRPSTSSLERRVHALVEAPVHSSIGRRLLPAAVLALAALPFWALMRHAQIHHGVETLLDLIH